MAKRADVPRKTLTFIRQPPDFLQLDLGKRGPAPEEDRKAVVTTVPGMPKTVSVER
jgi:hypothetical protein